MSISNDRRGAEHIGRDILAGAQGFTPLTRAFHTEAARLLIVNGTRIDSNIMLKSSPPPHSLAMRYETCTEYDI